MPEPGISKGTLVELVTRDEKGSVTAPPYYSARVKTPDPFKLFLLDVGAFLIVGLLYERHLGRHYPWILLASSIAVGLGVLTSAPEMATYRGLSGVDSGQFVAALGVEFSLAARQPRRWIWLAPAAAIFALKILYECGSGQMFFGTESLGEIGIPLPVAHVAGVLGAAAFLLPPARLQQPRARRLTAKTSDPRQARDSSCIA